MQETFRDIPNYEGLYQVSNLGNVKSLKFGKEKILKGSADGNGYLRVNLSKGKIVKPCYIHKIVAIAFLGHKPNGYSLVVDHIDNNNSNNHIDNLQIITQRENASKDIPNSRKNSKYTGVSWYKDRKKWHASIRIMNKMIHLGFFDNEYGAHLAYQKKLKSINK